MDEPIHMLKDNEWSESWCGRSYSTKDRIVLTNEVNNIAETTCEQCLLAASDFGDDCFARLCDWQKVWEKAKEAGEEWK